MHYYSAIAHKAHYFSAIMRKRTFVAILYNLFIHQRERTQACHYLRFWKKLNNEHKT